MRNDSLPTVQSQYTPRATAAAPPPPREERPTEKAVLNAISSVSEWFELGQQLDIPFSTLDEIEKDYHKYGTSRQRGKMVHTWLTTDLNASWSKLCEALDKIRQNVLAEDLRQNCCS